MDTKKTRILVVDDDELLRSLSFDILSEEYEVMEAFDGQDAWEKAQSWKPALVVTDLMMPRMHGLELCSLLKGPKGIPGIKIIVTSSKSYDADMEQAKKAGADCYIVKSSDTGKLLSGVRKLLSERDVSIAPQDIFSSKKADLFKPVFQFSNTRQPEAEGLKVRFWGTRGSCPCPGANTVRYGGNTACIEVRAGKLLIILECGTGIRELGARLMKEFDGNPIEGHIFVGHTHWDHIQGFPFFVPLYSSKNSFNIYSVRGAHGSFQSIFSGSMASDYFPIPLGGMNGKINFVEMSGPMDIGGARVSYRHLNHPGLCIGFRIETRGKVITYIGDHEVFSRLSGDNEISRHQDAEILDFARGSDILIREAQYTEEEYAKKKGMGAQHF